MMIDEKILEQITLSDIPKSHRDIAEMIGLESFIKLCKYCSGDEIYFPMVKSVSRKIRNRLIKEEYNGYNKKELSQKYNLSLTQIKKIIKHSNSAWFLYLKKEIPPL